MGFKQKGAKGFAILIVFIVNLLSFVIVANAAVNTNDYYTEFNDINDWTTDGGGIITPNNNGVMTIYADNSNSVNRYSRMYFATMITKNFDYEFKVRVDKFSQEAGSKIEFETHRILYAIKRDSLYVQTSAGALTLPYDMTDRWVTIRSEVRTPYVKLYVDNEFVLEYEMQPYKLSNPSMSFWVRHNTGDTVQMSVAYAKLTLYKYHPEITSPAEGQIYTSDETVDIQADIAGEKESVSKVEYYLNDNLSGTALSEPYKISFANLAPGKYTAYAVAYDQNEKPSISSSVNFEVKSSITVRLTNSFEGLDIAQKSLVKFTAVASDYKASITNVEFYVDGRLAAISSAAPYSFSTDSIDVGRHEIYAIAYNSIGQREISNKQTLNVFWRSNPSEAELKNGSVIAENGGNVKLGGGGKLEYYDITVPKSYNLRINANKQYNSNSTFNALLSNGRYALALGITNDGFVYKDTDGEKVFAAAIPNGDIAINAMVVGGYADIYLNGEMKFSYVLPLSDDVILSCGLNGGESDVMEISNIYITGVIGFSEIFTEDFSGLSSWRIDGGANTDGMAAVLQQGSKISRSLDVLNNSFEVLLNADISRSEEIAINISDGAYLAEMTFKNGEIYAVTSAFDNGDGELKKVGELDFNAKTLRIFVSKGLVQVFEEGSYVCSFRVAKKLSEKSISVSQVKGSASINWLDVIERDGNYMFEESFNTQTNDSVKELFTVSSGDWSIDSKTYRGRAIKSTAYSLIYNHALNLVFTSDIKIDSINSDTKVYLVTRWNSPDYYVMAGYNNSVGRWEIVQNTAGLKALAQSETQSMIPGTNYNITLKCEGKNISLYVNGRLMVTTANAEHVSFGKIGYMVSNTTAWFDNLDYEGNSRISKNVFETITKSKHTTDLLEHNGVLYSISLDGTMIKSYDHGLTWGDSEPEGNLDGNVLKLKNGWILAVNNRIPNPNADGTYMDRAYISKDGMQSWEGPFDVQPEWKTRDTMNGKITELSTGRVIYPAGDADIMGSGDVEDTGGFTVYYTDDGGYTWTPSETPVTYTHYGINTQEPKVVELSDGTLKLYCRTDRGYLYEITSHDMGKTWDMNFKPTQFISTLCAFNIERDPETGWHYIVWTYENTNDRNKIQHPRQRLGLAVSRDDMKTFEYVMSVDDWRANNDRFMNASLDITSNYVFANVARLNGASNTAWQPIIYRINKDSQVSTKYFDPPYIDGKIIFEEAQITNQILSRGFAFRKNSKYYYKKGTLERIDEIDKSVSALEHSGSTYIPLRTLVRVLNADLNVNGGTTEIKYLNKLYKLTTASSTVEVDGESFNMTGEVFLKDNKLYVPVKDIFELLGKKVRSVDDIILITDNSLESEEEISVIYSYLNSVIPKM